MTTFAAQKRCFDKPNRPVQSTAYTATLKRYGSTDSMAAWSHNKRERSGYALRKFAEPDEQKPPVYICRQKLNEALCKDDLAFECRQAQNDCSAFQRTTNAATIENICRKVQDQEKQLNRWRLNEERRNIKKSITKEYNKLNDKLSSLREESLRALACGGGDSASIGTCVDQQLNELTAFFQCHVSQPACPNTRESLKRKTMILERLKKLLHHNSARMAEWVNALVSMGID